MSNVDNDIPQWKKDLIARLRNQNKRTATAVERQQQQQLFTRSPQSLSALVGRSSVQQPILTCSGPPETVAPVAQATSREPSTEKCNAVSAKSAFNKEKMVQERAWSWERAEPSDESCVSGEYNKSSDSDSSEDLRYGPGIVNKLKNKYLSLALRESNTRSRPSILPLRKAASLENILDDDTPSNTTICGGNRLFQTRLNGSNDIAKNVPNRYRNAVRAHEMKRARSVETISRSGEHETSLSEEVKPKRESLHEEMLIKDKEGSDKPTMIITDKKILESAGDCKPFSHRVNRPKRIAPIMNEKEKPPVDVVKQAKLIFERRPDQRTKAPHQTGEVAAKVATYKNIIVQAKAAKKPPIKVKPVGLSDKTKITTRTVKPKASECEKPLEKRIEKPPVEKVTSPSLPSPIPDISRVDFTNCNNERNSKNSSLSETPDLIMTSSPVHSVNSSSFKISATENFIKEEIRHSTNAKQETPVLNTKLAPSSTESLDDLDSPDVKKIDAQSIKNINNASSTMIFNFSKPSAVQNHLPTNQNVLNTRTPPSQPLKLEINGSNNVESKKASKITKSGDTSPKIKSPVVSSANNKNHVISSPNKPNLTTLEIEKNLINTAKTLEKPYEKTKASAVVNSAEDMLKLNVPKVKKPPREPENNSIVFKFTDRKDIPDYVHNDGTTRVSKVEKPKVGEGGITLLPGASIDESFTDEDEEIMRSLEAPPSPCDVTFVNDNVLIDGKSSLSQKAKRAKMKISFVDAGPEIYEYPSESSLLIEDVPISPVNAQMGHTVPSLSGSSSLATYTPKSTEDFQPGVTRSIQNIPSKIENSKQDNVTEELLLQEAETPILFSAGTNSDILF